MRTKVVSFFIFFQELSNKKKIKTLRPKMTKIASRGGGPALKVYHPEPPHAQSLFLFPIVFGINLIQFSMGRTK